MTGRRTVAARHLDAATLAGLAARERSLLVHVATCAACRRRLSAEERDRQVPWMPDAPAGAAVHRLLRELARGADLDGRLAGIERERREAQERVEELLAKPDRWGTAAADPRYGSVEVGWQLLEAARDEEPELALRLIDLAGDIAVVLAARDPEAWPHRQLLVEVRCARAHRLLDAADRRGAARELRRAEAQLAPDMGYGRALYCRALARLRRDERCWEEALALSERAVALLDDYGSTLEVGQAQIEHGWILIDAGDSDEALPLLEAALPLVEGVLPWAIIDRLGLAVALADSGNSKGAGELLAAADLMTAQVMDPGANLRLRWVGAQVARRTGQVCSACRRLHRVTAGLLALGEHHEAARALLELLEICLVRQWSRALGMSDVKLALATLCESPRLHRRARGVIGLVLYVLLDAGRRHAVEVVASASHYLTASRYRPELPFRPISGPLIHLAWDQLDPRLRESICVEVGAGDEIGRRPAKELAVACRELISWRYEVLRQVRINFSA